MNHFNSIYKDKRVLVTGHTGFKGAWLAFWLTELGAKVSGFALKEQTPGAYSGLALKKLLKGEMLADLRDRKKFPEFLKKTKPDIIFHLAAQALVIESYRFPLETVDTNVLGTARVLDAVRGQKKKCAVLVVTSDKCYQNLERNYAYRENDPMGGHDPYSMSKGAAELVTASFRDSFDLNVASARAGNVIGGGDFAENRIIPDCVRALLKNKPVRLRNPDATRPWQHVVEPVSGYLRLGEKLLSADSKNFRSGWNFGPVPDNVFTVKAVVELFINEWGTGSWENADEGTRVHEAKLLQLNVDKAGQLLDWYPQWTTPMAVAKTAEWYKIFTQKRRDLNALRTRTRDQILEYMKGRE